MFQRFHAMKEREEGFTLIELLVVILIIAILAAIAIPVFLKQREKGWISQMESALKNAATAQESFATGPGNGSYSALQAELETEGWKFASAVNVDAVTVDATAAEYCVEVSHDNLGALSYGISTDSTTPEEGTCAAGVFTAAP